MSNHCKVEVGVRSNPQINVNVTQKHGVIGEVSKGGVGLNREKLLELTTYHHEQQTPTDTWHITHGLGFYPSVFVADSGGNWVVGDVEYVDENSVIIRFNGSFSGDAYFS